MENRKYLELLAKEYPTVEEASSEIIKLTAVSVLPKGTEYFLSDLHGQYDAVERILRSASGNTRRKISIEFGDSLSENEKNQLSNLVYEPSKFMNMLKEDGEFTSEWIRKTIIRLLRLLERVAAKYSRHKVRSKIPEHYMVLIDEMLNVSGEEMNKKKYFHTLVDTVIDIESSFEFIRTLAHVIQDLSIDHLHIVGDIYDRGTQPDKIVDLLRTKENVDLQFGNHDVLWIGAALGNEVNICNVIRIALGYSNFESLDGYGFNLRPLSNFAKKVYKDDPCTCFYPKEVATSEMYKSSKDLTAKMNKAISIIQFKLTSQLIERNPELKMEKRNVFKKVDFHRGVYMDWDGQEYPLKDTHFPTVDPNNSNLLTPEEEEVMALLKKTFLDSHKMRYHTRYLLSIGSVYKIMNNNLLIHGCIPMDKDGSFSEFEYEGKVYSGKSLLDFFDNQIRIARFGCKDKSQYCKAIDMFWYMWCGPYSPMFGKSQLSAFENFLVDDKKVRKECYDPYFEFSKDEKYVDMIFEEFGLDPEKAHLINGHVPVKMKDGENPINANGKSYVIDGGISKAYQPKTGIAGYTLTFNSHHLALAEHSNYEHMESVHGAYTPTLHVTEEFPERILIRDTDEGREILEKIEHLKALLDAYRNGHIKESSYM